MMGEIMFNVWLSFGEEPETHWQFLQPGDEAYALPGAVVVGYLLKGPIDGLLFWQPKPEWRDLPNIKAIVTRQFEGFTKFVRAELEAQEQSGKTK